MRRLGLQGAVRGRRAKTTHSVVQGERPDDRVNREFKVSRPNALWVSDLTYVATWRGFAYTAFVIDAYARRIVGWRVSHSLHTDLALDAPRTALHERRAPREGLVHHSDRGVQSLSLRYTERLVQRGIAPSVGSVGDSYDNALAESGVDPISWTPDPLGGGIHHAEIETAPRFHGGRLRRPSGARWSSWFAPDGLRKSWLGNGGVVVCRR